MAASSTTCIISNFRSRSDHPRQIPTLHRHGDCSFLQSDGGNHDLHCLETGARSRRRLSSRNRDSVVRKAAPEAAGDVLSSLSIPGFPGFSLPGDNPWLTGIAGLAITLPFLIQRLVTFTKELDTAAQTVEKIADAVGKVAEEVDKAAETMVESLPEGGLKKMVELVEDMAEETVKDAQMVEDLMDKVEEIDDKLEAFLKKQSKGADKA